NVRLAVLRAGCSYRQRLEALLAQQGVPIPRLMEFGTLETIFACVAAGLGITLLPHSLLGSSRFSDQLSVLELPKSEASVETVFVRLSDTRPSSALAAFLTLAEQTFRLGVPVARKDTKGSPLPKRSSRAAFRSLDGHA